jgi:hypothetical protein
VKLFQIEEPDGSPSDPDAPGAAVGIDATGASGEVAFAVGGNAVALEDREGFAVELPVPVLAAGAAAKDWEIFFEGARLRAERALGRPVTHAVIVMGAAVDPISLEWMTGAAEAVGLSLLDAMSWKAVGTGEPPVFAAAIRAEDLAPRPDAR